MLLARAKKDRKENPEKFRIKAKKYTATAYGRLACILIGMKHRCYNPKNKSYSRYGGRGITICAAWLDSLNVFRSWALANGYAAGLTIDRIENNGNYCPDNCQWLPRSENASKGNS